MNRFIYISLILFAFTLPLSIAVSETVFVLALIAWVAKMIVEKKVRWEKTPLDIPVLIFVAIAFLSSFWGINVRNSLIGFRTYGLVLIIYLLLNNISKCDRIKILVRALIIGASIMSVLTIAECITSDINPVLAGSMSEAGQLLITIGITTAILLYREERKIKLLLLAALLLMLTAEILNFKRGSWLALMFVLAIQGWIKSKKMILPVVFAAIAIFILYQPARDRLLNLRDEFSPVHGGRVAMWAVFPSILRDHPMGVGIDNVGTIMYEYNPEIEKGHAHLHNTPIQIAVEVGILGLAAFLWWMTVFAKVSYATFRRVNKPYEKALMLGIFSAFTGFLINSLVEFNFGDSEVVMVIYFIMGLTLIVRRAECGRHNEKTGIIRCKYEKCIPHLRSILILKLGSLGDVVHTIPLLNILRREIPDARIDWAIEKRNSSLVENHPSVDKIIVFERESALGAVVSFIKLVKTIRSNKYDMIMDLQGNLKGGIVTLLSGCQKRMGFARGSSRVETISTFFTNCKVIEEDSHIIERNIGFAKGIGIDAAGISFDIPVDESAKTYIDEFLKSKNVSNRRIVIIHPGVTWKTKKWPAENYLRLSETIIKTIPDTVIIVTAGPGEKKLVEKFHNTDIIVADNMTLHQLIAMLDRCVLFISSDTGPLHIASALGKNVIGLYGPTDPARNGPYGENNFVLCRCSPCWQKKCRDIRCMKNIRVSEVIEKAKEFLDKGE